MEVTVSLSLDADNPIEQSLIEIIRSIPKPSRHVSLVTALTLGFSFTSRSPLPQSCSTSSQVLPLNSPDSSPILPEPPLPPEPAFEDVSSDDEPSSSTEASSPPEGIHDYLQSFQC